MDLKMPPKKMFSRLLTELLKNILHLCFIYIFECAPEMHVCSRKEYERRKNKEYFFKSSTSIYIYS